MDISGCFHGKAEYIGGNRKMHHFTLKTGYKRQGEHNPVMTQRFGADPYALVYGDRVYLYMTGDTFIRNENGQITENVYSQIDTISVISSEDLVNWTDHGTVYAAGSKGAARWSRNSWAPAAVCKEIDGKMKFFLYFANGGDGIAVLEGDSPVGPFADVLQKPLISRQTPTCGAVTWLFDPAVLVDDDGEAYIYFGGGIPDPGKAANPGTARVARLGRDMISIQGEPAVIADVPYLYEDSGINKINGRYYYSYCSNFSVPEEKEAELGFGRGEIMWPGTFSKASAALPKGGTAMFALLALGGDIGCSGGPTLVGMVSGALGDNLKIGVLAGIIFPALLLMGIILCGKMKREFS